MQHVPATLFVVRCREEEQYWFGHPLPSTGPCRLEGIFATREQAEAFAAELELKAACSGDPGPLQDVQWLEGLMQLSDFEPSVFRDWMTDHDIPEPSLFADAPNPWLEWLRWLTPDQLANLYAALHRFRFYEILEVPFVLGEYELEQQEEWESLLPDPVSVGPEDDGFEDIAHGFKAINLGYPSEGWEHRFPPVPDVRSSTSLRPPRPPYSPDSAPPSGFSDDDIPF